MSGRMDGKIEEYLFTALKQKFYKSITGNNMEADKKFNKRAFVSAGMFISGIGLPFSGLMNHYLGFERLTAARHAWMSAHNIQGLLFLFFAIWHIKNNWKPLLNIVRQHSGKIISREALFAALIVFGFLGLFVMHVFHTRG